MYSLKSLEVNNLVLYKSDMKDFYTDYQITITSSQYNFAKTFTPTVTDYYLWYNFLFQDVLINNENLNMGLVCISEIVQDETIMLIEGRDDPTDDWEFVFKDRLFVEIKKLYQ